MSNKSSNTSSYNSYKKLKKQIKTPGKNELKKIENIQKLKKVLTIVIPALVVLVIGAIITFNVLSENGTIIRSQTVMESEHFKVDGAMMTYLFWDTVSSELEGDNASFYKMYDLKNVYDIDNKCHTGQTWREYFIEMTTETMQKMLTYAHYALSLGKTLNDEDNRLIEEELIRIEAAASVYGMKLEKYLKTYYGRGVNIEDIRKTLEIIYLSTCGMDMMTENLSVSDAEIEEYYQKEKESLKCADYLFYVTGISGKDNLTAEQDKFYSSRAQNICNSTSEEEYIKRVTDYLKEVNDLLKDDDEEKLNATELEEYIKSELESMRYIGVAYDKNMKDLDKWIFSADRQAGETYLNHVDGYGTFGVVYMLKPAYIPDDWKDTAKKTLLKQKEDELLASVDKEYVIDVSDKAVKVADVY